MNVSDHEDHSSSIMVQQENGHVNQVSAGNASRRWYAPIQGTSSAVPSLVGPQGPPELARNICAAPAEQLWPSHNIHADYTADELSRTEHKVLASHYGFLPAESLTPAQEEPGVRYSEQQAKVPALGLDRDIQVQSNNQGYEESSDNELRNAQCQDYAHRPHLGSFGEPAEGPKSRNLFPSLSQGIINDGSPMITLDPEDRNTPLSVLGVWTDDSFVPTAISPYDRANQGEPIASLLCFTEAEVNLINSHVATLDRPLPNTAEESWEISMFN